MFRLLQRSAQAEDQPGSAGGAAASPVPVARGIGVRMQVALGVCVILLVVLGQGFVYYLRFQEISSQFDLMEHSFEKESAAANDMEDALAQLELALGPEVTSPLAPTLSRQGEAAVVEFRRALQSGIAAARHGIEFARLNGDRETEQSDLQEVAALTQAGALFDDVVRDWQRLLRPSTDPALRIGLRQGIVARIRNDLAPVARTFRQTSSREAAETLAELSQRAREIRTVLFTSGVIVVIVASLTGFWLIRTVTVPLRDFVDAARDITAGNHERRLRVFGRGDFARLAHTFNHMLDALQASRRAEVEKERLLRERTAEIDSFFNVSSDLLGIAGYDGTFRRINPAFTATLGYPEEEIRRRRYLDFVHPDDRAATEAEVENAHRNEATAQFENRCRCADGSWKWLSWRMQPEPRAQLLYAIARDVTAAKAAELELTTSREQLRALNDMLTQLVNDRADRLQQSEERFRSLVDGVKDYAIMMLDVHRCVVSWNAGAQRQFGYTEEEILGQSFERFFPPEELAAGNPDNERRTSEKLGRYEEMGWRLRRDGSRFLAHAIVTALYDESGKLRGFAKVTRDVTEQQRAAAELQRQQEFIRLLMDNLAEGVVACDAEGRFTFLNKVVRDWHGADAPAIPPGKWFDYLSLLEPDGVTPLREESSPLARALRGERVRNAELAIGARGRAVRHVVANGDALHDVEGRGIGAVIVLHDVTERRLTDRHRLRQQRLESIGTLAGGIAHDLNNALAPVLLGLALLKTEHPDSTPLVQTMEASANRGAGMVRQLLTFARGVDGERLVIQPGQLLAEIQGIIEKTFPKNITLTTLHQPKLPPVLGDATQLHQVLLNLSVNARDAMPHGGTLTLEAEGRTLDQTYVQVVPEAKVGDYLVLRVKDSGTGIPPEIQDRIFEPFFSTKAADRGTGLGLSTVMGIVRSHGGFIRLYSTPQHGSSFEVYLPTVSTGPSESRVPVGAPAATLRGAGEMILVVDDESTVRNVFPSVLSRLNFKVLTAPDGAEAINVAARHRGRIKVVITDLHMPTLDGIGFVRRLRKLMPDVPVIVSSGRLERSDQEQFSALGVIHLLDKPFTQEQLLFVLAAALRAGSKSSEDPALEGELALSS